MVILWKVVYQVQAFLNQLGTLRLLHSVSNLGKGDVYKKTISFGIDGRQQELGKPTIKNLAPIVTKINSRLKNVVEEHTVSNWNRDQRIHFAKNYQRLGRKNKNNSF